MAQTAEYRPRPAARTLEGMTESWFDAHRLPDPPTGYVRVILGLITRSRASPA